MLVLAVAILLGAVAALGAGLWELSARRAALPAVVAIDKQELEDALDDAPWTSSDENADDKDDGPVLWYVAAPNCPACRTFERTAMAHLLNSGVEVRAILVAPRALGANTRTAQDVAALLKARDWTGVHLWMQGKRETSDEPLDPAEEDGLLEWSRQSAERLAALMKRNDLPFNEPALFWQNGAEWRTSAKSDQRAFDEVERELAPKA